MSDYQKEVILRWFEEVWNQGRRQAIDELLPADCVVHEGEMSTKGPEEFKPFFDRMRSAFSDIHVSFHDFISEGDLACLRWSVTMKHSGDGLGMPATGKQVHTSGMSMIRFANGRFAEAWQNWDMLGLIEQIKGAAAPAKVYMAAR
jgi:steroid delta-isomerase-like uncharacterized protein